MKRFVLGFIIGGVICSALTGFAVEYAVTANPFPVTELRSPLKATISTTTPTLNCAT